MVAINRKQIINPPCFNLTTSDDGSGVLDETDRLKIKAGTRKFTTAGINNLKKSKKLTLPDCQTINVVMSPNGLNAPPALEAITILMKAKVTNLGLSEPCSC